MSIVVTKALLRCIVFFNTAAEEQLDEDLACKMLEEMYAVLRQLDDDERSIFEKELRVLRQEHFSGGASDEVLEAIDNLIEYLAHT